MHQYIPNTEAQKKAMLADIGAADIEALFASVPSDVRQRGDINLPKAMPEMDVLAQLKSLANKNVCTESHTCFLGAGAYDHFIPSVVDSLLMRQEFYTAYTPYQPEISQGTLQAMFEYQTMICMLTGMDVSNASLYDGASAFGDAALVACDVTRKDKILVAQSVNPQYRAVLKTYARYNDISVDEFGYTDGKIDMADLQTKISENTAAVFVQTPNFFGIIEDLSLAAELAHKHGALLIVSCDPISLGLVKPPGEFGADIVIGEGQPLGNGLSFGGPYLGFLAVKENLVRKIPGRIVGETTDKNDKRGFVLTAQTREQHIRREKATSNICSNQALNALTAAMYLTALGKQGLCDVAHHCIQKANYAYDRLLGTGLFSPVFTAPFFKEFALHYNGDVPALNEKLLSEGIIGGYDLSRDYPLHKNTWLLAVTEKRTKREIDDLVEKVVAS
jgi:glycine dehydrogenase subunit 1